MYLLFDKKITYMVVCGMLFYHVLVVGLCSFWIYRFLIQTYDPSFFLLLAMFFAMTIVCDVLLYRVQGLRRLLIRVKGDERGIQCVIFRKKWHISWNDIHIFGVFGFSEQTSMPLAFLSCNAQEKYHRSKLAVVSTNRLVFQIGHTGWTHICQFMPQDMKNKFEKAIYAKQDCFYRC